MSGSHGAKGQAGSPGVKGSIGDDGLNGVPGNRVHPFLSLKLPATLLLLNTLLNVPQRRIILCGASLEIMHCILLHFF